MNFLALLFSLAGAFVAAFYALESFLYFQANGFAGPLLARLGICAIGVYFCLRNLKRVRAKPVVASGGEA
jgi:hypothetical protein